MHELIAIGLEALLWVCLPVLALGLALHAAGRVGERKLRDMSHWRPQYRPSVHDFDWHLHS